jgi:hypothetical protein
MGCDYMKLFLFVAVSIESDIEQAMIVALSKYYV